MPMENHEDPKDFSFLQETIKAEPVNKKKVAYKCLTIAALGLLFGLFASIGFCAFKPWVEKTFHVKSSVVKIPEDKEIVQDEPVEDQTEPVIPALDINSLKELYSGLAQAASQANRGMVTVTGTRGNEGWMEGKFDTINSTAGVWAADNGQELLILTNSFILKDAERLTVTFADGTEYPAALKKKDENLGLAMIAVARTAIKDTTWSQIEMAVLGNSNAVYQGNPIMVLGKPFGYKDGFGYGIISSSEHAVPLADGDYSILTTDIPAANDSTGALVNLNGEVVGIVSQKMSAEDSMEFITAYAVSDIKKVIELLSNGSGVPYIGIKGMKVPEEVITAQGLPQGLYVNEIMTDSPGMTAGIQNGDILSRIDGTEIMSLASYHNVLFNCNVGEEIRLKGMRLGAGGYVEIEYKVVVGSRE